MRPAYGHADAGRAAPGKIAEYVFDELRYAAIPFNHDGHPIIKLADAFQIDVFFGHRAHQHHRILSVLVD